MAAKSLGEPRETHVEVTKDRTRIVNEYVKGSGISLVHAGAMKVGLRNTTDQKRKLTLDWRGVGHKDYVLAPHSQTVVDAPGMHGAFVNETVESEEG